MLRRPGLRFLLSILMLGSAALAIAPSASATSIATGGAGSATPLPAIEILCDGDCSTLPATPAVHDGTPFDFVYGIRPVGGGFDLTLISEGNVFLMTPLRATDSIRLFAEVGVTVFANVQIDVGGEFRIDTGSLSSPFPPLDARIEPGGPYYDPICACLSIPGGGLSIPTGGIELRTSPGIEVSTSPGIELTAGGEIRRVESYVDAVTSVVQEQTIAGLTISREGDLYVDLSQVTLRSLLVKAGGSIALAGSDSVPVPEPGTAVLLAVGLAVLARSNRSHPA